MLLKGLLNQVAIKTKYKKIKNKIKEDSWALVQLILTNLRITRLPYFDET